MRLLNQLALPVIGLVASAVLLQGCSGDSDEPDAGATATVTETATPSPSDSPTEAPTATVTETVTESPDGSDGSDGSEAAPIPGNARDYGKSFVVAWVNDDGNRVALLGTRSATSTVLQRPADGRPAFDGCEGAAGSVYCTWRGDDYRLRLRIANQAASQHEAHAVREAEFLD